MFKSFVLFHASLSYPANTLKYLNREDTKHTFLYFTDFEVIPAEVNAIKQILNKQDSTRPIYTFIALRTIILQSVHGVNKSLSFIIKHADICSYHRKNTWNTSLPAHNGILNKTCQFFSLLKQNKSQINILSLLCAFSHWVGTSWWAKSNCLYKSQCECERQPSKTRQSLALENATEVQDFEINALKKLLW